MVGSAHGQLTFERSHRLTRRKALESLGTQTPRMASAADSRRLGREQGGGEPVDEAGSPGRSSGPKAPTTRPWGIAAPERGGADETTRASGAGSPSARFSRECMDVRESGYSDPQREFGVSYHPAHVSRLLKRVRLSLQKPSRRANQRDEEAIENWKKQRWPQLKKGH
jgi:hypothetical protein